MGFGLAGLVVGSRALSSCAATLVGIAEGTVAWFARFEPHWRPPTPPAAVSIGFVLALVFVAGCLRHRRRWACSCSVFRCHRSSDVHAPSRSRYRVAGVLDDRRRTRRQPSDHAARRANNACRRRRVPEFRGNPVRRMDVGEQVVSPYLWERGIRKLDVVAMTHEHDDHAQGLSAILRNFQPREFWTGATPLGREDAATYTSPNCRD